MTPQEKAKELVDKFDLPSGLMSIERKQCARTYSIKYVFDY